jgi:bifunctional DNA-binding transcriptional regulator/antitoxin component of YhaV-PrlF toxin-antitoxin module
MEDEHPYVGKCYGSAVVGPRGQLVVPMEARRELGIDTGTRFLVFEQLRKKGLMFVKVEAVQEILNIATEKLDEVAKALQDASKRDVEETEGENRPVKERLLKGDEGT